MHLNKRLKTKKVLCWKYIREKINIFLTQTHVNLIKMTKCYNYHDHGHIQIGRWLRVLNFQMISKWALHFRVWYSTHSMGYFQAEVAIIFKLPTQVWNLYSVLFALHPIFGKRILVNSLMLKGVSSSIKKSHLTKSNNSLIV